MPTTDDNRALLRRIFAALSTGDSRPFVDAMADEVAWTVTGHTPWSATYRGKPAVLGLLRQLGAQLAERYRATAELILADGDHVVVQARGHATTRAGMAYDNEYCFIFQLRDGRIVEVIEYLDTELVVLALQPPPPLSS
jgi:ketosteroid isomerase-like protein